MEPGMLAPELQASVDRIPRLSLGNPLIRNFARLMLRWRSSRFRAEGVTIETLRTGKVQLRIYRPDDPGSGAALLWIHGGGYIIGAAVMDDPLCTSLCQKLGITVVSVDYRLAPRHPFPAAAQDCLDGWNWLQANAGEHGIDPKRIAIGGQSAGGGLAACLVQRVLAARAGEVRAQWLFSPMLDDRTAARRELDGIHHRVWDNRLNALGWRAFLAQEYGAAQLPSYASAARCTDLEGMPPTWIGVGDIDLFCDEDREYAQRLRDAGTEVTFACVPGAPHGFESWASDSAIAQDYLARATAWLKRALSSPQDSGPEAGASAQENC